MSQQVIEAIREAIERSIPESTAEVTIGASAGHYNVTVHADVFSGKPMVHAHRMVYAAIAHLMDGDRPSVHAIDLLRALAPHSRKRI